MAVPVFHRHQLGVCVKFNGGSVISDKFPLKANLETQLWMCWAVSHQNVSGEDMLSPCKAILWLHPYIKTSQRERIERCWKKRQPSHIKPFIKWRAESPLRVIIFKQLNTSSMFAELSTHSYSVKPSLNCKLMLSLCLDSCCFFVHFIPCIHSQI